MKINLYIDDNVTGYLDIPDSPKSTFLINECGCIFLLEYHDNRKLDVQDAEGYYFLKCMYGDENFGVRVCNMGELEETVKKSVDDACEQLDYNGWKNEISTR